MVILWEKNQFDPSSSITLEPLIYDLLVLILGCCLLNCKSTLIHPGYSTRAISEAETSTSNYLSPSLCTLMSHMRTGSNTQ